MLINANRVISEMGDAIRKALEADEQTITITASFAKEVLYVMVANEIEDPEATTWVKEEDRVNHWHCEKCGFVEGCPALTHNYCPNCGRRVKKHG